MGRAFTNFSIQEVCIETRRYLLYFPGTQRQHGEDSEVMGLTKVPGSIKRAWLFLNMSRLIGSVLFSITELYSEGSYEIYKTLFLSVYHRLAIFAVAQRSFLHLRRGHGQGGNAVNQGYVMRLQFVAWRAQQRLTWAASIRVV